MTDRELLELAAKAAGYTDVAFSEAGECCIGYISPSRFDFVWSPLTDDGDALRLAVKLGMILVIQDSGYVQAEVPGHDAVGEYEWSEAATRRAIVRAAAEIGRNK